MFIWAHIYKVDKCSALNDVAAEISLVWVEAVMLCLTLARRVNWHTAGCLWLAVGLGDTHRSGLARVRDLLQDVT